MTGIFNFINLKGAVDKLSHAKIDFFNLFQGFKYLLKFLNILSKITLRGSIFRFSRLFVIISSCVHLVFFILRPRYVGLITTQNIIFGNNSSRPQDTEFCKINENSS